VSCKSWRLINYAAALLLIGAMIWRRDCLAGWPRSSRVGGRSSASRRIGAGASPSPCLPQAGEATDPNPQTQEPLQESPLPPRRQSVVYRDIRRLVEYTIGVAVVIGNLMPAARPSLGELAMAVLVTAVTVMVVTVVMMNHRS
jgi:hypothetical protein